jgi:hypothetical protein
MVCNHGPSLQRSMCTPTEAVKAENRALYRVLEGAVDEQLNGTLRRSAQKQLPKETRKGLSERVNGNGRKATAAQVKAIFAIAGERGIGGEELAGMLQEEFSVRRPEELPLRDASSLIDRLKEGKE